MDHGCLYYYCNYFPFLFTVPTFALIVSKLGQVPRTELLRLLQQVYIGRLVYHDHLSSNYFF